METYGVTESTIFILKLFSVRMRGIFSIFSGRIVMSGLLPVVYLIILVLPVETEGGKQKTKEKFESTHQTSMLLISLQVDKIG